MSTIFTNYQEMLTEADQLLKDDVLDAEDRVTIQSFYNGLQTMSEAEAKESGARNIVNHLLGYDSLATAQRQIESIYTRGKNMFDIELRNLPEDKKHLRGKWESCVRDYFNLQIKESRRLKPEWKSLAGEITLWGSGHLFFRDNYDWCPVSCRPYTARGTGILPDDITHLVLAEYMSLSELKTALRCALKREEIGAPNYWNIKSLRVIIKSMEGSLRDKSNPVALANRNETPDERDEEREMNSSSSTSLRTRLPVYYFYHRNDSGDGKSFDLVILPRITPQQQEEIAKTTEPIPNALYDHPEFYDCARNMIQSFFVDCKIGGKTKWHKVMGLGRLNYDSDVEIEENFNEAMSGARDNMRRLYAVKTASDWDILKTWASGDGPTNVLPPGVEIADVSRQPNFQHAMSPLQMLMSLTRKNAVATSSMANPGEGSQGELEINALERQNRNAEALAARMSDIYENCDALGAEMMRRFLNTEVIETDPGYHEITAFHRELRKEGIPIQFLAKMVDGKFVNMRVKTSRAAGDGNTVKRAMANAALMQRLQLFPAEAQQIILRRVTAEETDDYDFAESVVPYEPMRDTNQVMVANQENDVCDKQGILNFVPPLNKEDVDMVHIPEHFKSMQADIARGKVRPWDQIDLAAFMAKGGHVAQHIQKIKANKQTGELAQQLTMQLQKLAKQGQEFANNLNKQNEAAKQPMSEKDQAALRLQASKLQLEAHKQQALEEHRSAALNLSREKAAMSNSATAQQLILQEEGQAHKQMVERSNQILQAQDRALAADKRAQERAEGNAEAEQGVTPQPVTQNVQPE